MNDNLTVFHLPNGLKVMLKEVHSAALVSSWVWYNVGSRNELPGKTGLSHWVEHMQFKGTRSMSAQQMDHAIARTGGIWNALTSQDWTTYFETLPADALDLALKIESERMHGSLFDPAEAETERTVVISEREGSENDPQFRLSEAVQFKSFDHHPYRIEVIGSMEDLRTMTRDDLWQHYVNYYQPGNATLCIAGDFNSEEAADGVRKYFGDIAPGETKAVIPQPEGPIVGERRVEMSGPGEATFVQVAYRTPKADSEDFFAYTILDSLLAGPSSLNMFGSGAISNRTSRLYQALIESHLAVAVYGGLNASIDPGSYTFNLTLHPEVEPASLLAAFDQQLEALRNELVSQNELDRAVKQARALFAYGSDNVTNQAFWMGYADTFASYDWFTNYVDMLARVTPEQVREAAQRYLGADQRVVGIYHPDGKA